MVSSGEEHRPVENHIHEPTSTEETKLIVADQTVSSEIGGMLGDGFPAVDDLVHSEIGQYWVEEIIGRGSMGRVYRATHMSLERPCALKIMSPGLLRRKPLIRDRIDGRDQGAGRGDIARRDRPTCQVGCATGTNVQRSQAYGR